MDMQSAVIEAWRRINNNYTASDTVVKRAIQLAARTKTKKNNKKGD
jgi:hypothetical protein